MISVIVPIYNSELYLRKCIESIINQTYKDLEIILVNDGSTDKSEMVCQEYLEKDNRILYLKKNNGGQGSARNLALDNCSGDWISFVDSDDWIELDMYEKMIESARKNNADLVVCGWYRDHGVQMREQPCVRSVTIYPNHLLMKEYLSTPYITSSMCNKIYRRELWDDIRFPEIRAREDAAIIYKVLSKSKQALHIAESKYIQYVRSGSTEHSKFNLNKMESININKELADFIRCNYPELEKDTIFRIATCYRCLMGEIVSTFSLKENKDIYIQLYNLFCKEIEEIGKRDLVNTKEYRELTYIVRHPLIFKCKMYCVGIKTIIVDVLNKMVISLKAGE